MRKLLILLVLLCGCETPEKTNYKAGAEDATQYADMTQDCIDYTPTRQVVFDKLKLGVRPTEREWWLLRDECQTQRQNARIKALEDKIRTLEPIIEVFQAGPRLPKLEFNTPEKEDKET